MIVALSPEQEELRRVVTRVVADSWSHADVRRVMATDDVFARELWQQLSGDLGLAGLAVPERYGGAGAGAVELAAVAEPLGAALACVPFLSSAVLAVSALLACGDEDSCCELLPGIASGDTIATVAVPWNRADGSPDRALLPRASGEGGSWRLRGTLEAVLDGHIADLFLVPAAGPLGVGLFVLEPETPGVRRARVRAFDPTRGMGSLRLDDAAARLVANVDAAWPALARAFDVGRVVLAAEQVGCAQRALELAVGHARDRVQFGRPIGSFQAVQHICADVLVQVESARSAAWYAAWAAAQAPDELPVAAALAKAWCCEASVRASQQAVQVHGGVGFTWEHPIQLYLKRARFSNVLLGDPPFHRELIAQRLEW
ncbi:MAG TPA: acyl-CoA dehydrogenase family protein [Acidimicrobiales bacterium]|nr:acyl-CoA dehydrogenase family protein [Acidimicrobiales bacterium]